jgi:hypothetical protein
MTSYQLFALDCALFLTETKFKYCVFTNCTELK